MQIIQLKKYLLRQKGISEEDIAIAMEENYCTETGESQEEVAIINANGGTVQTTDLRVDAGVDLYVTVVSAEEAVVAYEKPAE